MKKHPLKKVIILGAGFAGLRALYKLGDYEGAFEITVVDSKDYSLERPALPEVAFEGKSPDGVKFLIPPQCRKHNANFELGTVNQIDPVNQKVFLDNGNELSYDYLLVATGAIKDYDAIEGYREYGYSVCDDKEAIRLYEHLESFEGGAIVTGAAKSEFGHKVPAPDLKAPCEGPIGEIMFMMDYRLRKEGKRERSSIDVFTPSKIFFEDVGDKARAPVAKMMQERSIDLHTEKELVKITDKEVIFADGSTLPCDLAIIIPPYKAPDFIAKSGLGDDKGWMPTDEKMRHVEYDTIYAIGDVGALAQPKLGHIAVNQADVAASDILNREGLGDAVVPFNPEVFCIMNMGGNEATLIYSNVLFGGEYDLAWHSPVAKLMKLSFDAEYHYTHGHMPPDFMVEALEWVLHEFGKR